MLPSTINRELASRGRVIMQLERPFMELLSALAAHNPNIPFGVRVGDGTMHRYGDGEPEFTLMIKDDTTLREVLGGGSVGFGEAYMRGDVDVDGDLRALLRFKEDTAWRELKLSMRTQAELLGAYAVERVVGNTIGRSRKNVAHHYDIGNEFYELWLDRSLGYSCAYFRTLEDSVDKAQENKYEHICRKLLLRPGEHMIDIGCGWGGLLLHAAEHFGVTGVGYTLSQGQYDFATERIARKGLQDRITIRLDDYRNAAGTFDKWSSIGMFEHVGPKHFQTYFEHNKGLLKPGAIGVLQFLGRDIPTETDPWILKYIFPGVYLPTISETLPYMHATGLSFHDIENLRRHYPLMLDRWIPRYEEVVPQVRAMYDELFVRMWRLYLAGLSVVNSHGNVRLFQIQFTNGIRDMPLTREYLCRQCYPELGTTVET